MATIVGESGNVQLIDFELLPPIISLEDTGKISGKIKNLTGSTVTGYQIFASLLKSDFGIQSTGGYMYPLMPKTAVTWKNKATINITLPFTLDVLHHDNSYATEFAAYQAQGDGRRMVPFRLYIDLDYAGGGTFDDVEIGNAIDYHANLQVPQFLILRELNGKLDDEGTTALTYIELTADERTDVSSLSLKLFYARNETATAESTCIDLTDQIPYILNNQLPMAYGLLEGQLATADNWDFLLVFSDGHEPIERRTTISRAFANVHMSGASTGGVAFGKFSAATEQNPLFECAYPAVFSGDVTVPVEGLLKTIEVTVASAEAVEGGATASYTVPVNAGDGWTPIGIVGYRANSRWVMMIRSYLDDNGEAACTVYNHGTPSRNVTIIMYVLCLRTG